MDLGRRTLTELFCPDLQLEVPAFRSRHRNGYWWDTRGNVTPGLWPDCSDRLLWRKITKVAGALVNTPSPQQPSSPATSVAPNTNSAEVSPATFQSDPFLGVIVVSDFLNWTETEDFQRRLVIVNEALVLELQLILSATYVTARSLDAIDEEHRLKRLLFGEAPPTEERGRFRVLPSALYGPAFCDLIDEPQTAIDRHANERIVKDWLWYRTVIEAWIHDGRDNSTDISHRLAALSLTLRKMLYIGLLKLDSRDDPEQISATFGSQVFPFQVSSQIKNQLLAGDDGRGSTAETIHTRYLRTLDKEYWLNSHASKLHFSGSRQGAFFYYWLQMRLGIDLPTNVTYSSFVQLHRSPDESTLSLLSSIHRHAPIFRYLLSGRSKNARGRPDGWSLNRIHLTTGPGAIPLLMWLYGAYGSGKRNEPGAIILRSLRSLESFAVRNMLCGASQEQLSQSFRTLLVLLRATEALDERSLPGKLEGLLSGPLEGGKLGWPSDEQVKRAATSTSTYGNDARWPLRMVLESVEEFSRESADEQQLPRELQLERLMPTEWRDSRWPTLAQDSRVRGLQAVVEPGADISPSELRDHCASLLGNFTLMSKAPSKAERTGSWEKKRKALDRQSPLRLNDGLSERGKWDEYDIVERSLKLAEIVCEIWPRPEKP